MDIETQIIKEYKDFMYNNSVFGDFLRDNNKILPEPPQSFSDYPTIVIKEANNTDYFLGKSTDRTEYYDSLIYQVEIFAKNKSIDGTKYPARSIINELKNNTFKFFNQIGFVRETAFRGEYIDINVNRYIMTFTSKINNWNMKVL